MNFVRQETAYILKHKCGKYFTMPSPNVGWDLNAYFTDDPLKATRCTMRELAESAIERNKNMDRSIIRWTSERALVEIVSACTVKELKIHTEFEVEK